MPRRVADGERMTLIDVAEIEVTQPDTARLCELERVIERGLQTYIEVGNALMEIRDSRLYRNTHGTFEDYCLGKWGWTRMRASQLIEAAQIAVNVNHGLQIEPPANERQARELSVIEPAHRAEVWQRAVETAPEGKVTARHVSEVVQEFKRELAPAEDKPAYRLAPLMTSASEEWYTPAHIVEMARDVLGVIDLDPCTSEVANQTVKAAYVYTKDDDGLAQDWTGRVYMNPPYGDVIGQWTTKLVDEYNAGNVDEAIALLPGRIDTQWFQPLFDFPICCIRGRLKFSGADAATFPSVVIYMGRNKQKFVEVFSKVGAILERTACS
jgi:hypothetical protein